MVVQVLAASPLNSKLRFDSRVLLPGMAKRLREVCSHASMPTHQEHAANDMHAICDMCIVIQVYDSFSASQQDNCGAHCSLRIKVVHMASCINTSSTRAP